MQKNIRKFISSSQLFSGFSCDINLDYCDSINHIINIFKNELLSILSLHNFETLIENVNRSNFHIHDNTFEEILLSNKDRIFYICECSSTKSTLGKLVN